MLLLLVGLAVAAVRRISPLAIWEQWDARWYVGIAEHGYHWTLHGKSALAFFPLYPLLVHVCAMTGLGPLVAGLLVANVAFGAALFYLRDWISDEYGEVVAGRSLWLVVFFPTSLFTAAPYSEGLFVLCAAAAFALAWRGHGFWAGFFAAGALLTRSTGVAVLPAVLLLLRRRGTATMLTSLPAPVAALAGWALYLRREDIGAAALISAQRPWHRGLAPPWTGFTASLHWLAAHGTSNLPWAAENLLGIGVTIAFLILTALAWRGMGGAMQVYCAIVWALILLSPEWLDAYYAPFSSVDRFVLVLLPLAPWAATRLSPSAFRRVLLASGALTLAATGVYLAGGWVG